MSNSIEDIKKKVEKGIKKTGFPLEMEIGRILKNKYWYPNHSHFYMDISADFAYKELDINAIRNYENFNVELFIECKHSEGKHWVFFLPTEHIYLCLADLKYMPRRYNFSTYVKKELNESIFSVLDGFCKTDNIALNSAVFKGDAQKNKGNSIRSAINTSIGAVYKKNLDHLSSPKNSPSGKRNINFACVVFDGEIFTCRTNKSDLKLEEVKYLKYLHNYILNMQSIESRLANGQLLDSCYKILNIFSSRYIVEFIHRDFFPNYIERLEIALKKLDAIPKTELDQGWI